MSDTQITAEIDMEPCQRCGRPVDPDLAKDGMHPECKTESYRRNQR